MKKDSKGYSRGVDERGTVIVEFALIAPVFLLLLFAIIELGYMVFVQAVLDGSARDAARLIRTGQAQTSGNAQQQFKTQLCNEMSTLVGCSNLVFNAQVFATWSAASTGLNQPIQRDKNGKMVNTAFSAGNAGSIVAVRVTYNYPFFTLWVGRHLGGSLNSSFLTSTVVFQNEPFT